MRKIANKIAENNYSTEQIINKWSNLADWSSNKYGQPIKLTKCGNLVVQDVNTHQIKIVENVL